MKTSGIKELKTANIDQNKSSTQKNQNIIKFFTKKNLALIEKKESYIFKKFKYKKLSKTNLI